MELSIDEIVKVCNGSFYTKYEDASLKLQQVTRVVLDSRKVLPGSVFIATIGERADGHGFLQEVYKKGALLVIGQKPLSGLCEEYGFSMEDMGCYLEVTDSLEALRSIAAYYRGKLNVKIVGITGSVGKTSTKEFIAGVLSTKYQVQKTEGNFNNEIGVPLTLLSIGKEHQVAVVEMGISDFGEMHRLSKMVRPDICVITNIGQCHLENLKTRDGILQAKSEMFDFIQETGEICLNGDDDKLQTLREIKGKKPHFFGMGDFQEEEVYVTDVVSKGLFGSDATLHMRNNSSAECGEGMFKIHVPLPGLHMVQNACGAACVARLLGLDKEQITRGIQQTKALGGRNHLIPLKKACLIDDCYNANPVSMKAALDLLALADTKKVAILGDMFELGENSDEMHGQIGAYGIAKGVDVLICVGERSKSMYQEAKKKVSATPEGGRLHRVLYFETRDNLLDGLEKQWDQLLPKDSTILVKASHGMKFPEVLQTLTRLLS